jgi:membrane protein YqaA with SNARE-associated domain
MGIKLCKSRISLKSIYVYSFPESLGDALNFKIRLLLILLIIIILGLGIRVAYRDVEKFIIYGSPVYRGFGIFTLCFIGSASPIIPIPYTAVILILSASMPGLNLIEVAVWGGLGSGLGQTTSWIIGKFIGKGVRSPKYEKRLKILATLTRKHRLIVFFTIFVFAVTPLPDSILFIILGTINYSLVHILVPAVLGKITMIYIIGLFGRIVGERLPFWFSLLLTILLTVIFIAVVEFVEWEKLVEKYAKTLFSKED